MSPSEEQEVVVGFEQAYAASSPEATWMGEPVSTTPLDLWIYQEIIHEARPDIILASSTLNAAYLADLCEMAGNGAVLSIGLDGASVGAVAGRARRLQVLPGSPVAAEVLARAAEAVTGAETTLAVLGSQGSADQLEAELPLYGGLVTPGSYLIVEDTRPPRGHPQHNGAGPRRAAAVGEFLRRDPSFVVDRAMERFYLTFNEGGYLKRAQ
jgi:cephalosporin hydroxylase